jgi:small subunit ribosomal protein S15
MIDKKKKQQIIKKFAVHENDTGSSEVQIALLTEEIKSLTEHLKAHKKDFSSRRGLLRKVAERRRLLRYLERENPAGFDELVKRLKLKIAKRKELTSKLLEDEVKEELGEETKTETETVEE